MGEQNQKLPNEIQITFPDGNIKNYQSGITGIEIAETISKSIAKKAFVMKFNNSYVDLSLPLSNSGTVNFITLKDSEALSFLRHDTAHILAQAVKEIYPETQVTIGPAIDDGFYYDFSREKSFTPEDLLVIEKRMHDIVNRDLPIVREVWTREKAINFFKEIGEIYKAEIISSIPETEEVSLYRHGDFIDLCRGPHALSTGKIGHAFKLMKIAGAYWRGDANNEMLQRIYGTSWGSEKDLKAYLVRLEEAEKRDHRKLGKELSLFHQQEEAPGNIFWHPKGWTLHTLCEAYIRKVKISDGYHEIKTPQLLDRTFWEQSGHWDKFRDNMFTVETEERIHALKPMSCPSHVQIFKQGTKSYRDLPIKYAEFGQCHRNEPSGAMHGLMRVRAFTQDDAHVFCTQDQIAEETKRFCDQLMAVYKDFGFENITIKYADRPEVRAGSDDVWDKAEACLKKAIEDTGIEIVYNPGEGAFYGPKLEFVLTDAIGRDWQCGTLQVDFIMPQRLGASYIGEDGEKHTPIMLHQAVLGSFERFIGILIEHYAGKFPLWLAPVQIVVTTITSQADSYAKQVYERLIQEGFRCEIDLRNEKINYKIREHSHSKKPLIFVVGERESAEDKVSIRTLGQKDQVVVTLNEAIDKYKNEQGIPIYKP